MKKLFLAAAILVALLYGISQAESQAVPEWAQKSCIKTGDTWQYSGRVHGISIQNIAVALARNAALSSIASSIGVTVNSAVGHKIEGSETDGYTETVHVATGHTLDSIVAYGVRQKELFITHYEDDKMTGRTKYDAYVLLEVSDADLKKAQADFARRAVYQEPIIKPKKPESFIGKLLRNVGLEL